MSPKNQSRLLLLGDRGGGILLDRRGASSIGSSSFGLVARTRLPLPGIGMLRIERFSLGITSCITFLAIYYIV